MISTPNRRVLIQLIIILCALPVFEAEAADVKPNSDFNLVFEEIGLMASATDYQLATMKVNLSKLEETTLAFKQTVIIQHEFIDSLIPIPDPKDRDNQSSYFIPYDITVKNRLLRNNQANLNDADVLVYQVQQIKEVLPHMKPHDINEIQADFRGKRSIFSIVWGLLGTYRGIMTNRKYDKLKAQLNKHTGFGESHCQCGKQSRQSPGPNQSRLSANTTPVILRSRQEYLNIRRNIQK